MIKKTKPLHPGTVLNEVYLKEMGLSQSQLARMCGCSPKKINEIVNAKKSITPEFAIALEKTINTSAEMWGQIQCEYDLWKARKKSNHARASN